MGPTPQGSALVVAIEGERLTMTQEGPGGLYRHPPQSFRIDETTIPRTIDFPAPGGTAARDELGIYEFAGETLRIAIGAPGAPRPSEFRSDGGNRPPHLLILKRKSAAPPSDRADR